MPRSESLQPSDPLQNPFVHCRRISSEVWIAQMRVNATEWSLVSKINAERLLAAIRDGDRDKVCLLRARALSSERKRSFRRKLAITFETKREARQPFARRSGVG